MNPAQAEVRNSSVLPEINEILRLSSQGVAFAPTTPGMTRSDRTGWQDIATSDLAKLEEWINLGYGLVAVARRDGCFLLDIDDPDKCKALRMPDPGLTYSVDTPSGGEHAYGLHDDVTRLTSDWPLIREPTLSAINSGANTLTTNEYGGGEHGSPSCLAPLVP